MAGSPVIGAVAGVASAVSGLSGLVKQNKDPQRIADNTAFYNAALMGSQSAADQLKLRSTTLATVVGQQDAAKKYAALMAAGAIDASGKVRSAVGQTVSSPVPSSPTGSPTPMAGPSPLVWGAVAVGVFLLLRKLA